MTLTFYVILLVQGLSGIECVAKLRSPFLKFIKLIILLIFSF